MRFIMYMLLGTLLFSAFTLTVFGIIGSYGNTYAVDLNNTENYSNYDSNLSDLMVKTTNYHNTLTNLTRGREDAVGLASASYNVVMKVIPESLGMVGVIFGTIANVIPINSIVSWSSVFYAVVVIIILIVVAKLFVGRFLT